MIQFSLNDFNYFNVEETLKTRQEREGLSSNPLICPANEFTD